MAAWPRFLVGHMTYFEEIRVALKEFFGENTSSETQFEEC